MIVVLAVLAVTIGVVIGAVAGYFGGWVDAVLMRFTDVILDHPAAPDRRRRRLRPRRHRRVDAWRSCSGLFLWIGLARLVRAEFLALREREFVDAARVAGASDARGSSSSTSCPTPSA